MKRSNSTLFRRLAAAAVGTAMLMSLTACAINPHEILKSVIGGQESTRPQEHNKPSILETYPSYPAETLPLQPAQPTAPKIEIDYDNLVTDAYMDAIIEENGQECCYHIPQFNLNDDAAQRINSKIYEHCSDILNEDVYYYMYDGWYPAIGNMVYIDGHKGELASILIQTHIVDVEYWEYFVYTISTVTGQEATTDELLAEFDMDREEFYGLVRDRLKQYWDALIADYGNNIDNNTFLQDCVNRTLADANIRKVIPYINPEGGLSFVAEIYSMAGAESYLHLINAEGRIEADDPKCTQKHTYRSSVSMDDPLEYFVENCDRRYFTRAEIESFDEEMCLYARNAIYAKSGWIFSSANLQNYFNRYSWYYPTVTADAFTEDMLNSYQIANRDLIVNHENALKSANMDELQYFIENCDRRYFTTSEISGLDAEELVYARNAIYAKSGRMFNMEKLANYFQKYSWYTPYIPADEFTEDMLNQYQTANRDLIVAREEELNGISPDEAYAIACKYWDYQEGDIAEETGFELYLIDEGTTEHNGTMYYAFRLSWLVIGEDGSSWLSTVDQVYVNSKTGECTYNIYS